MMIKAGILLVAVVAAIWAIVKGWKRPDRIEKPPSINPVREWDRPD